MEKNRSLTNEEIEGFLRFQSNLDDNEESSSSSNVAIIYYLLLLMHDMHVLNYSLLIKIIQFILLNLYIYESKERRGGGREARQQ